jgi:RNA polymerase sigma-70 factor (ECF subfamily)
LLRYIQCELESVMSFETDGERIVNVFVQRNPEKLRLVSAHHVLRLQ